MPYKSKAQSRYIHMKANAGEDWAKKFVNDAGGTKSLPEKLGKLAKHRAAKKR